MKRNHPDINIHDRKNSIKLLAILFFCCLLFVSCSEKTILDTDEKVSSDRLIVPTPEKQKKLSPVSPEVTLNAEQKKTLEESLPLKVREILEKAEDFEILAEVDNEPDGLSFEPNRFAKISDEQIKKGILEAFYFDASYGESPTACYIPHHSIRAAYQNKNVEIEICYQCRRFYVKSSFGNFNGGFDYEENRKSEKLLNQIIQSEGIKLN